MQDDSLTSANPEPAAVRIDLTSQDLRTGIIRLPRQLHDRFAAGELVALTTPSGEPLRLAFSPPRELSGLQDFLAQQELKPNDALILTIDGKDLSLEPYFRGRSEPAEQQQSLTGLFGEMPPEAAAAMTSIEEAPSEELNPELQPALFSTIEPEIPPGPGVSAETTEPAPPAQDEQPTGEASAEPWTADQEDPFGSFDSYSDDDFQDGSFADGQDDLDLPAMPAWTAPMQPQQAAPKLTAEDAPRAEAAELPLSTFHTVQRRTFARQGGDSARPEQGAQQPQQPVTSEAATEAPQPEQTPARAHNPQRELLAFINDPASPSILRATELARQFAVPVESVEAALRELSGRPDSRLSNIRPDYWLMKRKTAGN